MAFKTGGGMKVITTVCFSEETWDKLENIREKKCMTRSRYIQEALKAAIERDELEIKLKETKQ